MKWTQEELEKLYQEANAKAMTDKAFREALISDTKGTLEKLAGRVLPDDFNLKPIESDKGYAATYVVPDFAQGELDEGELRDEELEEVAAGLSFIGIVEICAVAVSTSDSSGYCGYDYCGGKSCKSDMCAKEGCSGDICTQETNYQDYCDLKACLQKDCSSASCSTNYCTLY